MWDAGPGAPYLSVACGASRAKFISYDDEISCANKVKYAETNGLGGVIVWELGG
ncbi:hypothetical protein HY251_11530 [bacterium]|nr:hypothetical protein [bacterium]